MYGFKGELIHNSTAYFLTLVGVPLVVFGAMHNLDKITGTGAGFISAAMLAFNRKTDSQQ